MFNLFNKWHKVISKEIIKYYFDDGGNKIENKAIIILYRNQRGKEKAVMQSMTGTETVPLEWAKMMIGISSY